MKNISKAFGAVQALTNVDFEVLPGEVMGLVGDNGAGKSTLIKIMAGAYTPDTGDIFVEGNKVHLTSPQEANRQGIETVYQDLALCDNLDVVKNMYLGREAKQGILLKDAEMERRTLEVLKVLNVRIPSVRVPVAGLSGGQRQCIAVAKTILRNPKVVLLDEPTAALGVVQTRQVLNLILRLKEQGLSVVVISHNLRDVFEVVDRVTVLRLGRLAGIFDIKNTTQERIIAAITGAEFGAMPAPTPSAFENGPA
ncbi:MAG: sugar ABC transporter ATP-binding protein [Chloroflexi bacterium]|nr:sugar ABC transporter ATP-binding protein [Chloroflexota bacterium]